jgi:gentisate 1,2-dioxygenase
MLELTKIEDQERWTGHARILEYSKAANPLASGATPHVPFAAFPASLHEDGPTRMVPLDLSAQLGTTGPATGPGLLASFMRIVAGESVTTRTIATSELYYVMQGHGRTMLGEGELEWEQGDFFTLPAGSHATHAADADAALYYVHDEPLMRYLGVRPDTQRFEPTLYPRAEVNEALELAANDPAAANRSRVSVLLMNDEFEQTLTVTHVLWAMYGIVPAGTMQKPHRHQSVALDLVAGCEPGCYTLLGEELDENGAIVDPIRADWHANAAFVTPPGLWHAHFNESGAPAYVIPVQDAGLHTYLRTLDIRFS